MNTQNQKPDYLNQIENRIGLHFILIPAGIYKIGKTNDIPFIVDNSKRYSSFTSSKKIESSGFWISQTLIHKSHFEKLETSIIEEITEEEKNSYQINMISDYRDGINLGWKKSKKDYLESDPIITLPYFKAKSIAEKLGLFLPNIEEWEIAARGKNSNPFPIDISSFPKDLIEKLPFEYTWEDPESTMGYRDTERITGVKYRLKSLEPFEKIKSLSDLKDLVVYGGEWNSPLDNKKEIYRSFLDPGLEKTVYSLSEDESQNENLRRSDHRSFCGAPLYSYSTDRMRIAGFRFVYHQEEKSIIFPVLTDFNHESLDIDWKLYSFLEEDISKVQKYLGEPDHVEGHDFSTGSSLYITRELHYYQKGIVVYGVQMYGKTFRPSPSKKITRVTKIRFYNEKPPQMNEIYYYKKYKRMIFHLFEWENISQESKNHLEQEANHFGIKITIHENNKIVSYADIEISDSKKLDNLKKEQGTLKVNSFELKKIWDNTEHNWEIRSIHYLPDKKWISVGLDGFVKIWEYGKVNSLQTFSHSYFSFSCSFPLDENRLVLGTKTGKLFLLDVKSGSFQILFEDDEEFEITIIKNFNNNIFLFSGLNSYVYAIDISSQKLLYKIEGEKVLKEIPFVIDIENEEWLDCSSGKFYDIYNGEYKSSINEDWNFFFILFSEFSRNKEYLILVYDHELAFIDYATKKIVKKMKFSDSITFSKAPVLELSSEFNFLTLAQFGEILFIDLNKQEIVFKIKHREIAPVCIRTNLLEKKVLLGNWNGSILSFSLESLNSDFRYGSHKNLIYSLNFQRDNNLLACADSSGNISIYDLNHMNLKTVLPIHNSTISTVEFISPDSILTGSWDHYLKIHDLNGKQKWKSRNLKNWIVYSKFVPDGEKVFFALKNGEFGLFHIEKNEILFYRILESKQSYPADFSTISLNLESNEIIYFWEKKLYIADLKTGQDIFKKEFEEYITNISFGMDFSEILLSTHKGEIIVLDRNNLEEKFRLEGENESISQFCFMDEILLTTGKEESLKIWNYSEKDLLLKEMNSSGGITPACFIGPNRFAIAGSDGRIRIYEIVPINKENTNL